jgi:hypothetical protein
MTASTQNKCEFERRLERTPGYDSHALAYVVHSADAMAANWSHAAEGFLRHIVAEAPTDTAAGRLARIFAHGLLARIACDESVSGNLYFEEPSPGAMLAAFDKLIEATPFIRFGYSAANASILQAVKGRRAVHLVDIGIGSGRQWYAFLDELANTISPPPVIRMTGIDVPMSADEPTRRLEEVGESLGRYAKAVGIEFSFRAAATPVQDMDFGLIDRLHGEGLAINAVFALHHVPTTDGGGDRPDSRSSLIRRLREAAPDILALVEPDAEHNSLPLNLLIRESIAHYLTVFDALAELLPDDAAERQTLEQAFFGREILNILSTDGPGRVERHERHANWRRRLTAHGFAPTAMGATINIRHTQDARDSNFSVAERADGIFLAWKQRAVVAATAWKPATDRQAA